MKELQALEERLHRLFNDGELKDSRQVFDVGVEFGKVLERSAISDYEFRFWGDLDKENTEWKNRLKLKEKVEQLILKLVCLIVNEYINENGSWCVSYRGWSSDVQSFDERTLGKFCVQILRVTECDDGENFDCRFKVVGQLAAVFKDYAVGEEFNVVIENIDGVQEREFYDSNQVSSGFINASVYVNDKLNADKLNESVQEIGKLFLFEFMVIQ